MNFFESLGFKLYGFDAWVFYHSGEIVFKVTHTLSGKIIVTNNINETLISSRDENEIKVYLITEIRDFKIKNLL